MGLGGHDWSSGFLVQSPGGHDIPMTAGQGGDGGHDGSSGLAVQSTLQDWSSGFLVQSGLHDGSSGVVVQSTGCVMQDASLGFALQSTCSD